MLVIFYLSRIVTQSINSFDAHDLIFAMQMLYFKHHDEKGPERLTT